MKAKNDAKPFHVVYLGESGFPIGLGAIQKMILISKSLIEAGAKVTVICRKGKFDPDQPQDFRIKGEFENIQYVYTSGTIYRPKNFFRRNLQKVIGSIGEFQLLFQLKKNKDLDAGIVSCYNSTQVLLYKLYSRILGFPIVLNYVEWASSMEHRRGWLTKMNDLFFDRFLVPSMDGALPISEVLVKNFQRIAPQKKTFKIPILCDFEKFNIPRKTPKKQYFLYCGALDYLEIIDFILKAFDQLPDKPETDLVLVLGGGTEQDLQKLEAVVRGMKKSERVKINLNVPHSEIPAYYRPALALLIPLRPTLQDAARFPHKIGEYVASENPMITTNFGEVAHYFKDEENALIAETYNIERYSQKMKVVLENPDKAKKIGAAGRALGLEKFNYKSYGQGLKNYLESLTDLETTNS